MALFNNFQDSPKIVTSGRVVNYSVEPTNWNGNGVTDSVVVYYKVTRTSRMAFKHVGLTKSAAESGANALRREYTRRYMRWTADLLASTTDGKAPFAYINQLENFECTSDIKPEPIAGDDWGVFATIEETDVIITRDELKDYDSIVELFQQADARDIISDNPSYATIAITSAEWSSTESVIRGKFRTNAIQSWISHNAIFEIQDGEEWVQVGASSSWSDGSGEFSIADMTDNARFRITYGSVTSNPWKTTDMPVPNMSIISAVRIDTYEIVPQFGWHANSQWSVDVYVRTDDMENSCIDMKSAWTVSVGYLKTNVQSIEKIDANTFKIKVKRAGGDTEEALGYSNFVTLALQGKFIGRADLVRSNFISLPYVRIYENSVESASSKKRLVTIRAQVQSDLSLEQLQAGDLKLSATISGDAANFTKVGSVSVITVIPKEQAVSGSTTRGHSAGTYAMFATFKFDADYSDVIAVTGVVSASNASGSEVSSPTFAENVSAAIGTRITSMYHQGTAANYRHVTYDYLDGWTPTYDSTKLVVKAWRTPRSSGESEWEQLMIVNASTEGDVLVSFGGYSPSAVKVIYDGRESQPYYLDGSVEMKTLIITDSQRDADDNLNLVYRVIGITGFDSSNIRVFKNSYDEIPAASVRKRGDVLVVDKSAISGASEVYFKYPSGDGFVFSNSVSL